MKGLTLKTFRIYSIVIPVLLFILVIEAVMIFSSLPSTLGTALSVVSSAPILRGSVGHG
jgi:hypothetical protein